MSGGLRDRALECTSGLFDDVEPEIRAAAMAEAFDDLPNEAVVEHGLTDPIYLQTISVQGFRGIGKNIDINLDPVPGVTVISARNGVGKSSVSEAVELVLTGQITRIDKPQADLGRSLQHADTKFPCLVTLTTNDGTTLEYKAKNPGAKVAASKVKTGTGSTLESVPWASALLRFRPFIGVAEHQAAGDNNGQTIMELLGDVVGDDLSSITARSKSLNERLRTLRRAPTRDDLIATASDLLADASPFLGLLSNTSVTPGELRAAAAHTASDSRHSLVARWNRPEEDAVVEAVRITRSLDERVAELMPSQERWAPQLAGALASILNSLSDGAAVACPLCMQDVQPSWITEYGDLAKVSLAAAGELERVQQEARNVGGNLATLLLRPSDVPPDIDGNARSLADTARQAHSALSAEVENLIVDLVAVRATATDYGKAVDLLNDEVETLNARNQSQAADDRGIVKQLADDIERAEQSTTEVRVLEHAIAALEKAYVQVLDGILASFRTDMKRGFARLCWETGARMNTLSHNNVVPDRGKRPNLSFEFTLNGHAGGRGMLSQGQMNALALATLLPRATDPRLPTRFVILDDPIVALDEVRIDRLAQLLLRYARQRGAQIIVFTHDFRLERALKAEGPSEVRMIRLERQGVHLKAKPVDDPAHRLWQLSATAAEELPADVARRSVPVLARRAMESAANSRYRAKKGWSRDKWVTEKTLRQRLRMGGFASTDRSFEAIVVECDNASHHGLADSRCPKEFLRELCAAAPNDLITGVPATYAPPKVKRGSK